MSYIRKLFSVFLLLNLCFFSFEINITAKDSSYGVLYRDALTKSEMTVYDTFLKNSEKMKDGKTEIKIRFAENISKDDISDILQRSSAAFVLDHPECFWISYEKLSFTYIESDGGVSVITAKKKDECEYYFPSDFKSPSDVAKEAEAVKEKIDKIIKNAEEYPSAYDKLKFFHDFLCKNNVYNEHVRNGEDDKADKSAWRALSALTSNNDAEKGPVCEGYSKAFKLLCDAVGVPCVLIPGDGINTDGVREAHMWCAVMIFGKWYGVDVTWDDAITSDGVNVMRDNYFLCGENTEDFSKLHIPDMEKYFLTALPTPTLAKEKIEVQKSKDITPFTVSGFSAVYGEKAKVKIMVPEKLKNEKISLYKGCIYEGNKLYEGDAKEIISIDTSQLSCVNDKKIVAVYEDEKGNYYISCADIELTEKSLELDSTDVTIECKDGIVSLVGELKAKTGQKLSYDVTSELTDDNKKVIVKYTDIIPFDMNYTSSDSLTLEFELPNDNSNNEIYKYIAPALIVIFCVIVSLLKRK